MKMCSAMKLAVLAWREFEGYVAAAAAAAAALVVTCGGDDMDF